MAARSLFAWWISGAVNGGETCAPFLSIAANVRQADKIPDVFANRMTLM